MENVTLNDIKRELIYLNRKVEHIEHILIPEVQATAQDKQNLEQALKDHRSGKTINFKALKKG